MNQVRIKVKYMDKLFAGLFCLFALSQGFAQIVSVSDSILPSQPVYEIIIEKNVAIPMGDGDVLHGDLYRPGRIWHYDISY